MTAEQFNEKYDAYIEKGHYGLSFESTNVTNYLDLLFEDLIKIPDFSFSQIKLRYNMCRFHCNLSSAMIHSIEDKVDEILKRERNERSHKSDTAS